MTFVWLSSLILGIYSCSSDDDDDEDFGNWVDRSIFDGTPRSNAAFFTIGNLGYVGTGYDGDDRLGDFWVYEKYIEKECRAISGMLNRLIKARSRS